MGLEVIRYIQGFSNNFLDIFFQCITMVGEELFLASLFTAIYWTIDKRLGEFLGFSLFSSLCLNGLIKDILKAPRPIGEEGIRTLRAETATGYSFPSGHSQTGSTFFTSLSVYTKNKIIIWVSAIIIPLIGISRLYLGVHYPKDVVGGILLGLILPFALIKIFNKVNNKPLLYLFTTGVAFVFLFFAPSHDYLKCFSLLVGFTAGSFIEYRFVHFSTDIKVGKKLLRWLLGLIGIGVIYATKLILPTGELFIFIRYMSIGLFGVGLYPYVFTKLGF